MSGAPAWNTVYAYNGEQYAPQTGLIYLRARSYDPKTGTFTSKDTYAGEKTNPVSRNRYTYANNNPVSYQDPSGHAGILKNIVSKARSAAKAVTKTVSCAVTTVSRAVINTAKAVANTAKSVVQSASRTVNNAAKKVVSTAKTAAGRAVNTAKTVFNTAKSFVINQTKAVLNRVAGIATTALKTVTKTVGAVYDKAVQIYGSVKEGYEALREDVSNYVADKVKRVETFANETWENAKDIAEEGLKLVIEAKQSIAQTVQDAGSIHSKITGHYNTTTFEFTKKASVRNWLAGKSYEEQYEYGINI